MSKYASDIKELKDLIGLGNKILPELKGEREGVSARLRAFATRLNASLAATEKTEAEFAKDLRSLADSVLWLSDADTQLNELTALLQAADKAKDEAAMQRDVYKGAKEYLDSATGIKWKSPLFAQRDEIVKALKQMILKVDNNARKESGSYPAMLDKIKRHIKKQETAVNAMDDLLKKLAAVDF